MQTRARHRASINLTRAAWRLPTPCVAQAVLPDPLAALKRACNVTGLGASLDSSRRQYLKVIPAASRYAEYFWPTLVARAGVPQTFGTAPPGALLAPCRVRHPTSPSRRRENVTTGFADPWVAALFRAPQTGVPSPATPPARSSQLSSAQLSSSQLAVQQLAAQQLAAQQRAARSSAAQQRAAHQISGSQLSSAQLTSSAARSSQLASSAAHSSQL